MSTGQAGRWILNVGVVLGMAVFFAGTPARAEQKFEPKQEGSPWW
jgi:hypothetical protein